MTSLTPNNDRNHYSSNDNSSCHHHQSNLPSLMVILAIAATCALFGSLGSDESFMAHAQIASPTHVASIQDTAELELGGAYGFDTVTIDGRLYAVIAAQNDHGIQLIDITDPGAPTPAGKFDLAGPQYERPRDVATFADGDHTYAIVTYQHESRIRIINITNPTESPTDVVARQSLDANYLRNPQEVAIVNVNDRTYAVVAAEGDDGIQIIDVTDPANPIIDSAARVGNGDVTDGVTFVIGSPNSVSPVRIGDNTFVVVTSFRDGILDDTPDGVHIINMTTPNNPFFVSNVSDTAEFVLDDAIDVDTIAFGGSTYAVVASNTDRGIQIINITNPTMPVPLGSLTDNSLSSIFSISTILVDGYAYALTSAINNYGIQIINITDPNNPTALYSIADTNSGDSAHFEVPRNLDAIFIDGNPYILVPDFGDALMVGQFVPSTNFNSGFAIINITRPMLFTSSTPTISDDAALARVFVLSASSTPTISDGVSASVVTTGPQIRLSINNNDIINMATDRTSISFIVSFDRETNGFDASDIEQSSGSVQNLVPALSFSDEFDGSASDPANQFTAPTGIFINSTDHIFVVDSHNSRIQIFNSSAGYQDQFGEIGSGTDQIRSPTYVATNSSGHIFVSDFLNHRIQVFDSSGGHVGEFGNNTVHTGIALDPLNLSAPQGIAINGSNHIFVVDQNNHRIQIFNSSGGYLDQFGSVGSGDRNFFAPSDIAINASNHIFVVDQNNHRIQIFNSSIDTTTDPPSPLTLVHTITRDLTDDDQIDALRGITIDSDNNIYIVDTGLDQVHMFNSSNVYQSSFGVSGTGSGQLDSPIDVAINSTGYAFVTEQNRDQVLVYAALNDYSFHVVDPDDQSPLTVEILANAVQDNNGMGNAFASNRLSVNIDRTAPILDDASPDLNLVLGTLTFDFDETIDVSEIDLAGIRIEDASAANPTVLTGATLPSDDGDVVVITLTNTQRTDIQEDNISDGPVQITVVNDAIQNLAGVGFAGLSGAELTLPSTLSASSTPVISDDTITLGAFTRSASSTPTPSDDANIAISGQSTVSASSTPTISDGTITLGAFTRSASSTPALSDAGVIPTEPYILPAPTAVSALDDNSTLALDGVISVTTIDIQGSTYAITASNVDSGIQITNITDPASPSLVTTIVDGDVDPTGDTYDYLAGAWFVTTTVINDTPYALVAANGFTIIDITNPASPKLQYNAIDGQDGFTLLANPRYISVVDLEDKPHALVVSRDDDGVQIMDLSLLPGGDPQSTAIGYQGVVHLDEGGDILLDSPRAMSTVEIGDYTYAVVASFDSDSLEILNITDPDNLRHVSNIVDNTERVLDGPRSVDTVTINDRLYAIATSQNDDGIQIIDITNPAVPMITSNVTDTAVLELDGARHVTTVHINENTYAIVAGRIDDGIQIIDITDPVNPNPVHAIQDGQGGFTELDNVSFIDTAVINGTTYAIAASNLDDGIQIIDLVGAPSATLLTDVSDSTNQRIISFTVSFSEDVTELELDNIMTSSGDIQDLAMDSESQYTFNIADPAQGPLQVRILAGAVQDADELYNRASNQLSITIDNQVPTVSSASADTPTTITLHMSEPVTVDGVLGTDFGLGGVASTSIIDSVALSSQNSSQVILTLDGNNRIVVTDTTILLNYTRTAGFINDTADNTLADISEEIPVNTDDLDFTPAVTRLSLGPGVTDPTNLESIPFTVSFSKPVNGFESNDITRTFGDIDGFVPSDSFRFGVGSSTGGTGGGNDRFNNPQGIDVDSEGRIYIVDNGGSNNRIKVHDGRDDGAYIRQLGGSSAGIDVNDVAVNATEGFIYAATSGSDNQIRAYDISLTSGANGATWTFGDTGSGNGQFRQPEGITISPGGKLIVADTSNNRIKVHNATVADVGGINGGFLYQFGSTFNNPGTGESQFDQPTAVAFNSTGHMFVADAGNNRIQIFDNTIDDLSHTFLGEITGTGLAPDDLFDNPRGIAFDSQNNLYVADAGNNRIVAFDSENAFRFQIDDSDNPEISSINRPSNPYDIAVDPVTDVIYVINRDNHRLVGYGAPNTYTFNVTSTIGDGNTLEVSISADVARDDGEVGNAASNQVTVQIIRQGEGNIITASSTPMLSDRVSTATATATSITASTTPAISDDITSVAMLAPLASITGVTVPSSIIDGTYGAGSVVDITVMFDKVVTLIGDTGTSVQLELNVNNPDNITPTAIYQSGNNTDTLLFRYTIQESDTSSDLDYLSTTSLIIDGTGIANPVTAITDGATGNAAVLTLTAPGTASSLGANRAIAINAASDIILTGAQTSFILRNATSILPDTITIPSRNTNATLILGPPFMISQNSYNITSALNVTHSNARGGDVTVSFQASTNVTGTAGFTGEIILPYNLGSSECDHLRATDDTNTASCILIGQSSGGQLTVPDDKPVRLLLEDQAQNSPWFATDIDEATTATQITNECTSDDMAGFVTPQCYRNVGDDLVIWTNHFTVFGSSNNVTRTSGGGGGNNGDSTSPSLTTSFDEGTHTISINGIGIAPQPFKTTHTMDAPISVRTGNVVPITLTLYENLSWESISHVELCTNKQVSNNQICDSDTKIIWDKTDGGNIENDDGTVITANNLEIIDPNNLIRTATLTITEVDSHVATFEYDVIFSNTMSTSDLQIYAWDTRRNALAFTIEDAIVVIAGSGSGNNNNSNNGGTGSSGGSGGSGGGTSTRTTSTTTTSTTDDGNPQTSTTITDDATIVTSNGTRIDNSIPNASFHNEQIRKWAGFASESLTDGQLLASFEITDDPAEDITLPSWTKDILGKWAGQDKITAKQVKTALSFMYNDLGS